jgi:hypothetical protein
MKALIERTTDGRLEYWTGDEWVSPSVTGWRDAASYSDHAAAADELDQHADEDGFEGATVVDLD